MPRSRISRPSSVLTVPAICCVFLFLGLTTTIPAAALPPCFTALPLSINTTLRSPGSSGPEIFAIQVDEPGVLVIESSTTAAGSAPIVELVDHSCARRPSTYLATLHQTPTELALGVSAGLHYLSVSPGDPAAAPSPYKLRVTFLGDPQGPPVLIQPSAEPPSSCSAAALPEVDLAGTRCAEVSENTDPWDCDIISGGFPSGILVLQAQGVPIEASIYAEEGCQHRLAEGVLGGYGSVVAAPVLAGEHRLAVESVDAAGAYTLRLDHFPICPLGEQDDHSDSGLCATALELETPAGGSIANPYGDDEDAFYFRLDAQQTVAIDLQAAPGLFCRLFDDRGQRLTSDAECAGAVLVRTLGAGLYRIKVMGSSSQAAYTLGVEVL